MPNQAICIAKLCFQWFEKYHINPGAPCVTKLHNQEFRGLKSHIDISLLYVCTVCTCVYI